MKNLSIGKKLMVSFGIVLILFLFSAITSIYILSSTSASYKYFYENPHKTSIKVMDMRRNIQASAKFIMYAITTKSSVGTTSYIDEAQKSLDVLEEDMNYIYENSNVEKAVLDNFKNTMSKITAPKEKVFQFVKENRNTEAVTVYFSELYPNLVMANEYLMTISDLITESADASYNTATNQTVFIFILLIVIIFITFISTVIIGLYLTKGLKKPIMELEHAAKQLSSGNLNEATITYEAHDELGSLAENMRESINVLSQIILDQNYLLGEMAKGNFDIKTSIEKMYIGDFYNILISMRNIRDNLSNTLSQINQTSDQVASGSDQVASGAQALSQGATEQASAIEELAATINEISSQIKTNSSSAQQASSTVGIVSAKVLESNEQMTKMTTAMSEISASSSQIGKIIKTIEDIAFQTNILALNAAVEAARAGEAGKGFAVVADEVRNLASKSSDASKSTSDLIESSITAVKHGTEIAKQTAVSLLSVVDGTKEITEQITQIAKASQQQAGAIVQVTQGVEQISNVVQTNSATAEESAAASEELSGQAQVLKSLVSKFKMNRNADDINHFQAQDLYQYEAQSEFEPKSNFDSTTLGQSEAAYPTEDYSNNFVNSGKY